MEKSLSVAFGDSLKEESISCIGELAEVGLDAIMEDGILKDVPILSTAIALYKIGDSLLERHNLKKAVSFLTEIDKDIVDEKIRSEYQQKFQRNEKFRNQEIEYLLVIINRYIGYDKPKMLAKLYLAYLREAIKWNDVCKYSEVIDRFLPGDFEVLKSADSYRTERDIATDALQRLIAQGLVIEGYRSLVQAEENGSLSIGSPELVEKNERNYKRTEFGDLLVSILEGK